MANTHELATTDYMNAQRIVQNCVLKNQSTVIEEMIRANLISEEYLYPFVDDVMEWWLIDSWLAERLKEQGEVIIEEYGCSALAGGVDGLYAGLPVIFLVTLGGFMTNAAYCLQQNIANKSVGDYAKGKVWGNNLVFCALAGVLWYMQFFGLEMGKSFLTESPVLLAFSWCILMALNVTFSNVWGIILKEWKGVSAKTITVLICGLVVLIFSLVFPNLF